MVEVGILEVELEAWLALTTAFIVPARPSQSSSCSLSLTRILEVSSPIPVFPVSCFRLIIVLVPMIQSIHVQAKYISLISSRINSIQFQAKGSLVPSSPPSQTYSITLATSTATSLP